MKSMMKAQQRWLTNLLLLTPGIAFDMEMSNVQNAKCCICINDYVLQWLQMVLL